MGSGQGSVYQDPKTGENIVVYQVGTEKWVAESNKIDAAEKTKGRIMRKIKSLGYTKFVGYESI